MGFPKPPETEAMQRARQAVQALNAALEKITFVARCKILADIER